MTESTLKADARDVRDHHLHVDWLPDAVTSLSLVLGCLSLVAAFDHHYERAAALIDSSLVCDVLDGMVARISHSAAPFGAELDSLADVVAFGVAPAGLVYSWALRPLGLWGVFVIGPFVICAALRLARFNLQTNSGGGSKTRFVGLPVPGAAATIAGLLFGSVYLSPISPLTLCSLIAVVTLVLAALMVSRLPYPTLKIASLRDYTWKLTTLVGGLLVAVVVLPRLAVSILPMLYLLAGPLIAVIERKGEARRECVAH
jgi:CDP-diacylglycerol---serine O-phosphatidyltransferase